MAGKAFPFHVSKLVATVSAWITLVVVACLAIGKVSHHIQLPSCQLEINVRGRSRFASS